MPRFARPLVLCALLIAAAACAPAEESPVAEAPAESPTDAAVAMPTDAVAEVPTDAPTEAATQAAEGEMPQTDELDCSDPQEGTLAWVVCNVRDAFTSRNTAALLGYMAEDFAMGPYRSEWSTMTPDEAVADITANRLPADPTDPITFTADRSVFPDLDGMAPESLLPPEANVVLVLYGQGLGPDGAAEALLYFTEPEAGRNRFAALLWAPAGFED